MRSRRRGFTLIEMIVVIAIIAVLAAILLPVYSYARGRARTAKCAAHLSQIVMALKMYYDDHRCPPSGDLRAELVDYVDNSEVFVCPEDRGGTDSYSGMYVARPTPTGDQYVLGCLFHGGGNRTTMALGKADTSTGRDCTVVCNGQEVAPGDVVTGGVMEFSDGSRLTIGAGMDVGLLASAANRGRAYSIVWVPSSTRGQLQCDVAEGSAFEVVTPAAIAGTRDGATFIVSAGVYSGNGHGHAYGTRRQSKVDCVSGTVLVEDRVARRERRIGPGETAYMSLDEGKIPKDPKPDKHKKPK